MATRPQPHARISGDGRGGGWWVFPLALLVVTAILIVVAVIVQGTGPDLYAPPGSVTTSDPGSVPRSP